MSSFGSGWRRFDGVVFMLLALCCWTAARSGGCAEVNPVQERRGERLVYEHDDLGNRIPDFSHCGYAGAGEAIPDVPATVTVAPSGGDDGAGIQAAIDQVAALPVAADGFRGAVLLAPGEFDVAGQLHISASGIVLCGSGAGKGGTTLRAIGVDRRALVRIEGVADRQLKGPVARDAATAAPGTV